MIARIWHGYTTPEDSDSYEATLKPELLPGLSKVPGFLGSYLLRRASGDEVEFITIILWESYDALRSIAGENWERLDHRLQLVQTTTQSGETVCHVVKSVLLCFLRRFHDPSSALLRVT